MKKRFIPGYLILSGVMLLFIGCSILAVPDSFFAGNGIALGEDPSLRSEIRAPGAMLAGAALVILTGVFRPSHRPVGLLLCVLVFGAFGIARLISMMLDGIPSQGIIIAAAIELVRCVSGRPGVR
ncbi:DUF4345 domain-containing protein [Pontiella agarivorans]|uniref:DUF4345 domain-containing protein n=1 Tax=Pontiella agarivorans TaxID=3038953 RepID=A0ABU5MU13_9BACT|nr:DUF4345 domain-containing protein [Pontiella agarivorans]MDZ8117446.1 DUF4345 domain-containing protein [Pontiella agarivorans]